MNAGMFVKWGGGEGEVNSACMHRGVTVPSGVTFKHKHTSPTARSWEHCLPDVAGNRGQPTASLRAQNSSPSS